MSSPPSKSHSRRASSWVGAVVASVLRWNTASVPPFGERRGITEAGDSRSICQRMQLRKSHTDVSGNDLSDGEIGQ